MLCHFFLCVETFFLINVKIILLSNLNLKIIHHTTSKYINVSITQHPTIQLRSSHSIQAYITVCCLIFNVKMNEIETRKLKSGVKAIQPVLKRTYKRQKLDESIPIKLVLEESFISSNEIFGEEEVAADKVVNEAIEVEEEVGVNKAVVMEEEVEVNVHIIRSCVHVAKNQYFIWTSGEHLNNEVKPDSKTQQFGVPVFIQNLFKEYLETDASLTANSY